MLNLQRIVAPASEPVTLAQAKAHCRIDSDYEDDLVSLYITAAREYVEKRLNRPLIEQTWRLSLDTFPWGGYCHPLPGTMNAYRFSNVYWFDGMAILLPRPPLISVTSITYVDYGGTQRTVDPSTYTVDATSEPARIVPVLGSYWPYLEAYQPSGVQVTFTAGFGPDASSVPTAITMALLLLVGHFYANREATSQGVNITNLPLAVDALLSTQTFTAFSYGP